jgi:hypothetical protein
MPTDQADPAAARFPAALEELVRDYLHDGGCPCRFPRFRSTVGRETDVFGAPMMTWEQYLLITRFDSDVKLTNSRPVARGWEGICARCGATVQRRGEEYFRDRWMEHMRVAPLPGVTDLGAPAVGALPHCWPFFTVGGGPPDATVQAEIQFPRFSVDAWLAWMRERP